MRGFPTEPVDVLFAAYGGGHVTMLRPVSQTLASEGVTSAFLGLTTAQADLASHGFDYFGFAELEGAHDAQVQAWGREMAGPETSQSVVSYHESVAYHGLNFRDLVTALGEKGARENYARHGRQSFLPVATMEVLLKRLRPKVVVSTNSPRSEQALFVAARNLGIPSLCLVDLFATQEIKWISQPRYASTICVLNAEVASFFAERGCDPQAVVITGNPAFDNLYAPETAAAGLSLRAQKGFGDKDKVILWASNVEPERHPFSDAIGDPALPRRIEAELRRIVASEDGWHLVVRYHPSEKIDFEPGQNVSQSTRAENLHALVNAVDVVVVTCSTVGLEAHLAGRPVISVDLSIFTAEAPYSHMGISQGVTSVGDLELALKEALGGGDRLAVSDAAGAATQAVAVEVKRLLALAV